MAQLDCLQRAVWWDRRLSNGARRIACTPKVIAAAVGARQPTKPRRRGQLGCDTGRRRWPRQAPSRQTAEDPLRARIRRGRRGKRAGLRNRSVGRPWRQNELKRTSLGESFLGPATSGSATSPTVRQTLTEPHGRSPGNPCNTLGVDAKRRPPSQATTPWHQSPAKCQWCLARLALRRGGVGRNRRGESSRPSSQTLRYCGRTPGYCKMVGIRHHTQASVERTTGRTPPDQGRSWASRANVTNFHCRAEP